MKEMEEILTNSGLKVKVKTLFIKNVWSVQCKSFRSGVMVSTVIS